jgi:putative PIN family toxin of toxin-antitoxin system
MRVFIDTNILISSALFPQSIPAKAFYKAVLYPNQAIICQQNIDEMRKVWNLKFPHKIKELEKFLEYALQVLELADIPTEVNNYEQNIRDLKDRPILRAAINANVDVFITGDKDFLESGLKSPKIMTPNEFVNSK